MNTAALKKSQKSFACHHNSVSQPTLLSMPHDLFFQGMVAIWIIWIDSNLDYLDRLQKILKFINKGLVLLHLSPSGIRAVRTQQAIIFIAKMQYLI